LLNQQNTNKGRLQLSDTTQVKLQKDTSQCGIHMPEEFQIALDQEEGAFACF